MCTTNLYVLIQATPSQEDRVIHTVSSNGLSSRQLNNKFLPVRPLVQLHKQSNSNGVGKHPEHSLVTYHQGSKVDLHHSSNKEALAHHNSSKVASVQHHNSKVDSVRHSNDLVPLSKLKLKVDSHQDSKVALVQHNSSKVDFQHRVDLVRHSSNDLVHPNKLNKVDLDLLANNSNHSKLVLELLLRLILVAFHSNNRLEHSVDRKCSLPPRINHNGTLILNRIKLELLTVAIPPLPPLLGGARA